MEKGSLMAVELDSKALHYSNQGDVKRAATTGAEFSWLTSVSAQVHKNTLICDVPLVCWCNPSST